VDLKPGDQLWDDDKKRYGDVVETHSEQYPFVVLWDDGTWSHCRWVENISWGDPGRFDLIDPMNERFDPIDPMNEVEQ
jgi:hypothetical protein